MRKMAFPKSPLRVIDHKGRGGQKKPQDTRIEGLVIACKLADERSCYGRTQKNNLTKNNASS